MNPAGLTDSLAGIDSRPHECPHCHSASRIVQGLCLGCLLSSAVSTEDDGPDEFDQTLAAIPVADTHWRLGNYEILEEIGRGGMGVIYRARQRHSRRIVALKRVLSYHADSRETLARFRREAEAAASLDHPNILPIYEVGESEEGMPYFSMKYASGGSLLEVGPALFPDRRRIVSLMAKVIRAVQHAHRQGILHRDLKPGNILLDGRGEPMVSDFGLAKWLDTSTDLTRTLTIFGTPGYIAPEQAEGRATDLTPAADVYSLGAILFGLLAGRPPFLGDHALAVICQASDKPAPKLRSLVRGADKDLVTICARCLEREPSARYRSAGDLAEDLERWLEGRPIIARPVSPPIRLWRWTRRNPISAAAASVALLLAAAVVFIQLGRSRLERASERAALYQRSLAIMPFLHLDTGEMDASWASQLAGLVQRELIRSGPSRVVPVTECDISKSLPTPDTIRQLSDSMGTRTVLWGTVRQINRNTRVSMRLLDARTGNVLLQHYFSFTRTEIPAADVASAAVSDLTSALARDGAFDDGQRDPVFRNSLAADYFRAGEEFQRRRDKPNLDRALECFDKAITSEPASALARASFAMTAVGRFYSAQASAELLTKAKQFGREAIKLNPALPEAHRALSGLLYAENDLLGSREQAFEAIELGGPNEGSIIAVGDLTKALGRPDVALRWHAFGKIIQQHPSDYEFTMADCWADLAADEKAEQIYQRVSALHPDLPEGWIGMCRLRLLEGNFPAARQIYQDNLGAFTQFPLATQMAAEVEFFSRNWPEAERFYRALADNDPDGGAEFFGAVSFRSALGRLRQLAGARDAAEAVLTSCLESATAAFQRAPNNPNVLYRLAAIEASLAQKDSALTHLRHAYECGWIDYRSLRLDPRFDGVREGEAFEQICKEMAARVASMRAATISRKMTQ